jgi:hypothetical protein
MFSFILGSQPYLALLSFSALVYLLKILEPVETAAFAFNCQFITQISPYQLIVADCP